MALLEIADGMRRIGVLSKEAHEKITLRLSGGGAGEGGSAADQR
jgi:hypothetical protein